jgi:hypothetical protein
MKIWLDDERPAPEGWVGVRWPDEVIALMQQGHVEEISLDHDLGDDRIGTGYDVVLWIEREVALNKLVPPVISVHSANPVARRRMEQTIQAINRFVKRNVE